MRIIVDNRVRVVEAEGMHLLSDEGLVRALKKVAEHPNPEKAKLVGMSQARRVPRYVWAKLKSEPDLLKTWRVEGGALTLPRGCMPAVREVLSSLGVPFTVSDRRCPGMDIPGEDPLPAYGRALWPHQERAVAAMLARQQGIVRAPTGSGKSSMALAFVTMVRVPTLVVVPNGALFDDWVSRCTDPKELGLKSRDVGIIRGKKRSFKPITIAVQRTLAVHGVDEQMRRIFGCVIEDEVQQAPAATFFGAIDPFPAKYRIGISANEGRKDQKECLTHDLFGGPIIDIPQGEVDRVGATMPVKVVCVSSRFRAPWYRNRGREMALDFETLASTGVSMERSEDSAASNEFDRLLREMAADEAREKIIVDLVVEKAREGRQVLVFCRRVAHVQRLEQRIAAHGIATGLLLGGAGELERVRRATTKGIRDGSVRVGVGTVDCMGTGNDLPSVEVGVLTFPLHTNKFLFRQVRGRICRASRATGKEIAELYCICDPEVYPGQVKAYARAHGGKVESAAFRS